MTIHRLILMLALLATVCVGSEPSESLEASIVQGLALLDQANVLGEEHDPQAKERYREAAAVLVHARTQHHHQNAELNHAIGNAYLKSDELGHAILAYRQALALDPTNLQARESLTQARAQISAQPTSSRRSRVIDWLVSWRGHFPRSTVWTIATGAFLVGWIAVAFTIWRPTPMLRTIGAVMIVAGVVFWGGLGFEHWESTSRQAGVLIDPSTVARTGPSSRIFEPAFENPLLAGTECTLVAQRDGWVQIQLRSNALGWIPQDSLALVSARSD